MKSKNSKNEDRSEPYVNIVMANFITLSQIYCILNIFTSYFDTIPNLSIDKVSAANFLLALNISGLVLAFISNERILVPKILMFPFLNEVFKKITSLTQFSTFFSGVISVISTILLYFSEYRNLVVFKGKIVLLCVVILAISLFLIYLFVRFKR